VPAIDVDVRETIDHHRALKGRGNGFPRKRGKTPLWPRERGVVGREVRSPEYTRKGKFAKDMRGKKLVAFLVENSGPKVGGEEALTTAATLEKKAKKKKREEKKESMRRCHPGKSMSRVNPGRKRELRTV